MSYLFWKKFACGVYLAFWDVVFVCVENDVCEDGVCRHQTDTACTWLVCHGQKGLCKLYPPYPASPKARALSFLGEASHATRQHGWRSASSLRETFESNPGPKPTLKPLLHTLTPPHSLNTLIHQSNPLNPPHPHSPQHTHRLTHPHLSNPFCPLLKPHPHTTEHLFNCTHLYTSNNILDLWMSPGRVVLLLARWQGYLNLLGCRTPPQLQAGGVSRQQQQ